MTLIEDWRHVLARAWSVRWIAASALLAAFPAFVDSVAVYVSPQTALKLTLAANVAALLARFIKQDAPDAKS